MRIAVVGGGPAGLYFASLDIRQDTSIAAFDPLFVIDGGGVKWAKARQSVPKDSWASASIRETVISGPQSGLLLL